MQIRQTASHEAAMRVLLQSPVADLAEIEKSLDGQKGL
jgi:hypothetical protein